MLQKWTRKFSKSSLVSKTCVLSLSLPPPPGRNHGHVPWFRVLLSIRRRRHILHILYISSYTPWASGFGTHEDPSSRAAVLLYQPQQHHPHRIAPSRSLRRHFGSSAPWTKHHGSRQRQAQAVCVQGVRSPSPLAPRPGTLLVGVPRLSLKRCERGYHIKQRLKAWDLLLHIHIYIHPLPLYIAA